MKLILGILISGLIGFEAMSSSNPQLLAIDVFSSDNDQLQTTNGRGVWIPFVENGSKIFIDSLSMIRATDSNWNLAYGYNTFTSFLEFEPSDQDIHAGWILLFDYASAEEERPINIPGSTQIEMYLSCGHISGESDNQECLIGAIESPLSEFNLQNLSVRSTLGAGDGFELNSIINSSSIYGLAFFKKIPKGSLVKPSKFVMQFYRGIFLHPCLDPYIEYDNCNDHYTSKKPTFKPQLNIQLSNNQLTFQNTPGQSQFTLINTSGQEVLSKSIHENTRSVSLNSLSPGIYFARVQNSLGEIIWSDKIIFK